jgi:hypothetical protein
MGSKPTHKNSVAIPAEMLEKIAAINHLTIADVVRLFLVEALAEGARNWELWKFRPPARLDFPMKRGHWLARTRIAAGSKIRFLCRFSRAWGDLRESGYRPLRNFPPLPLMRAREGLSESVEGNRLFREGPVAVYRDLAAS